jgi:hypothetical protein
MQAWASQPRVVRRLSIFAYLIFFFMNITLCDFVVMHALTKSLGPRTLIAIAGFSFIALVPVGLYLLFYGEAGFKKSKVGIFVLLILQLMICSFSLIGTLIDGKF